MKGKKALVKNNMCLCIPHNNMECQHKAEWIFFYEIQVIRLQWAYVCLCMDNVKGNMETKQELGKKNCSQYGINRYGSKYNLVSFRKQHTQKGKHSINQHRTKKKPSLIFFMVVTLYPPHAYPLFHTYNL